MSSPPLPTPPSDAPDGHHRATPPHAEPSAGLHTAAIDTAVQQAVRRHGHSRGNLLPVLHAVQDALGWIPESSVPALALALNRSRAEIHGVIRFYPLFRQTPPAPVQLEVCRAEACQAMGGNALAAHAAKRLACDFNGRSPDGQVDLLPVYCLGLCAQAPAVALNGVPHARVTPLRLDELLDAGRS